MSFPTNWDVSKYKNDFECDEHWDLRRKFIETHKTRFPEDKLVCLAQVFFNIEFLGCRYPEKTMHLVEELSKDVAEEHRQKQKGKLKRSFVQASDAAGDKIKRKSQSSSEPPTKATRHGLDSCFVHAKLTVPQTGTEQFPGFILYEHCRPNGVPESCPLNILTQSAQKNQVWKNITFDFAHNTTPDNEYQVRCDVKINDKLLASARGASNKEAKTNAAIEGLKTLRKSCYTIQAKHAFFSDNPEVSKEGGKQSDVEKPIAQDNIGSRMMQKMGWTGSGLGKQQQGIQAPIQASSQVVQRSGFGRINGREFENKFKQVFKDFIGTSSDYDLVFTPDFSSDERKILHKSENVADEQDSEENLDDLFSAKNLSVESSSEEEENSGCMMCKKLKVISGEERDDEIYNMMWGTGVDSIEHVISQKSEGVVVEITDGETHTGDVSASEDSDLDIFIDYDSDELNTSGIRRVKNILSDKKAKSKKMKRLLKRKPDKTLFRYFLPDNSSLDLNVGSIKENDLLYKYTYPYGETKVMRKTVLETDLVNIAGLQDLLFKHAICQTFKPDKTQEKLKPSKFKCQYNVASLINSDSNSSLNTEKQTKGGSSFSRATLLDNESVSKSLEFLENPATFSSIEKPTLEDQKLGKKLETLEDKVKIFFLDGSHKYISLETIKDNEELREFTKYSPEKTSDELRCGVTIKDLKKYKSLRQVFADIIATYKLQFGNTDTTDDRETVTSNETTTGIKRLDYSLISSQNRIMKSVLDKGKIFLPDGSYKMISVEDIRGNEELTGIFSYYPGKPISELTIMVTVGEVKNHESLQDIFSEYVIAHKTQTKITVEKSQVPMVRIPNESSSQPDFETSIQDNMTFSAFEGSRPLHNEFNEAYPVMYPGGPSYMTPGYVNIEHLNPPAPFTTNNPCEHSLYLDNMNQKSQTSIPTAIYPKIQLSETPVPSQLDRSFLMTLPSQREKLYDENNHCPSATSNLEWPLIQSSVDREDAESICSVESRFTNQSKRFNRKHNHSGRPRIKVTFEDETFKRINTRYIEENKYYVRYKTKMKEVGDLGLTMNDIPPADYSDPSDEDDNYNKWSPRFMPSLTPHATSDAEKQTNEEGKLYLQRAWENYLIKFASSFKNPYGQKWKEFLELKSSEVDSIFNLRDLWREFMKSVKEDKLVENSPLKHVQESNTGQNFATIGQSENLKESEMIHPSPFQHVIHAPTFPTTSHMAHLFGFDLNKSQFEEIYREPNKNSVAPDLESHLNASTITTVDSTHLDSQFIEPSLVESMSLESHINAASVTIVDSIVFNNQICASYSETEKEESSPMPSQEKYNSSKERKPATGPKKLEDGILVGYLPDGSKIKFQQKNGMVVIY